MSINSVKVVISELEWEIEQVDRTISRVLAEICDSLKFAQTLFNDNPNRPVDYSFENKARQMAELSSLQSKRNALISSVFSLKGLLSEQAGNSNS